MHDEAMVWNTDHRLQVTSLTARLRDFAGIGSSSPSVHVSALWEDHDPFPVRAHQWALEGETLAFETTVRGRRLQVELEPLFDLSGTPCGVTGRAVEASDDADANRASLEERLRAAFARSERSRRICAALFINLDGFKAVNAEHGRACGDRVLSAVADRLGQYVRPSDTVARLGGDEYVVVLEQLSSAQSAADTARSIFRSFDEPLFIDDAVVRVAASIGVATSAERRSPSSLIAAACREMYVAKRNGGNGIKVARACQVRSFPAPRRFATLESA